MLGLIAANLALSTAYKQPSETFLSCGVLMDEVIPTADNKVKMAGDFKSNKIRSSL